MLFFVLPPDHPLQSPYILAAPVPAPRRTGSGSDTQQQQQQQRGRSGAGSVMRCLPLWGLRVDGLLQAFQTYTGSALGQGQGLGASSSGASGGGGAGGKRLFPRNTTTSTTKSKSAPQSEGGAGSLLRPLASSSANQEKERDGPGLNNEIDFRDFSRALAM
jgi:hypothetical protein